MTIRVIISSYGSNVGPYFRLISIPSGSVISLFEVPWIGIRDFTAPDGTTDVSIEHVDATGAPGLCEPTILEVTPLNATTTTTTTGGATPPTTSTTTTGTTSSTSSTTTTTTTSEPVPSSSTTTSSTSTTTSTTSQPTTTTTTTDGVPPVEICTQLEITIAPEDIADSTDNTLFDNGTVYLEYTDCDEIEQTVKYTVAGTYYVCAWEMAQVTLHHYRGNLDKLGDSSWYNTEILCPVSSSTTTTTTTSTPRTLSWSYNTQIGNYDDFLEITVNGVTKVNTSDTGSSSITVHDGDYITASSHISCSGDLTYAYIEYTMLPDAGDDEATCPDQTASVYFTVSNDVNVSACTGIGECGVL